MHAAVATAQVFSLQDAEQRARDRYPLIRQKGLIQKTSDLTAQNLSKNFLPQLTLGGQATYQSDVTQLLIPNAPFKVEPLSRDQYRLNLDMNQVVYDGGMIRHQRELTRLQSKLDDSRVEMELHRLMEKIDQLYFNVLLLDAMMGQVASVRADIDNGIRKVSAQLEGGVALKSSLDVLKAEQIRTGQRMTELLSTRSAMLEALGVLTDTTFGAGTSLRMPAAETDAPLTIDRPEQRFYRTQIEMSKKQTDLLASRNMPRASVFLQGGYGRPGLNMLQNEFALYGLGGIRINWAIGNLYTKKNDAEIHGINGMMASLQEEAFLKTTNAQARQQFGEVSKLRKLIDSDDEIIALRESVKKSALAQLEAGVITPSDYLREVNAEDQSRQALKAHEVQLAQAEAGLRWLMGRTAPNNR
jgi:outer membrane protein TolC